MLNEIAQEIHENAKSNGFFYSVYKNTGEMLCLVHLEISKALEADRENNHCTGDLPDGFLADIGNGELDDEQFRLMYEKNIKGAFEDELANTIIQVLNICAYKEIDINNHLKIKMRYNTLRSEKHGKAY